MGLMDIFYEIELFFIDISTYSDAEKNVAKYKKIVKNLKRRAEACEEALKQAGICRRGLDEQFTSQDSSAEGEWKTNFNQKEETWNTRAEEVISKMQSALETATERKTEAEKLQIYWEEQVQNEEAAIRQLVCQKELEKEAEEED